MAKNIISNTTIRTFPLPKRIHLRMSWIQLINSGLLKQMSRKYLESLLISRATLTLTTTSIGKTTIIRSKPFPVKPIQPTKTRSPFQTTSITTNNSVLTKKMKIFWAAGIPNSLRLKTQTNFSRRIIMATMSLMIATGETRTSLPSFKWSIVESMMITTTKLSKNRRPKRNMLKIIKISDKECLLLRKSLKNSLWNSKNTVQRILTSTKRRRIF